MPIAIHWDWEGHSASKPLQSSCAETLLAPRTVLRAAARAIQIFTVFIFEYGASIRNIRKFAPFKNFPLYGTSPNIKLKQHWKITIFWFRTSFVIKAPTLPQNELVYTTIALGDLSTVKFDGPGRNREKQGETGRNR